MKKKLSIVLTVLLLLTLTGCGAKKAAVTTPTADPTWQTVQTFTGSNITRTAPFTIDAGVTQWRITWSTTPEIWEI